MKTKCSCSVAQIASSLFKSVGNCISNENVFAHCDFSLTLNIHLVCVTIVLKNLGIMKKSLLSSSPQKLRSIFLTFFI